MLTAALDVARLGARAPLSIEFLHAAAPGYCTSQQQAEAPGNWFEQALGYATSKLHGAGPPSAPLGAGMGRVAGYTVADYLLQHASRERRSARVPASTWDAVLSHIRDPADAARLADSARIRLLYRYAIPLYRHAANAGEVRRRAADRSACPDAATSTGPPRYCVPGPTSATGRRRAAGRSAGRARRPGGAACPGRRRRRVCCRAAGRSAGRARRPGGAACPGRCRRPGCRRAAGRSAGRLRRRGWVYAPAPGDVGDQEAARRLADLLADHGDVEEAAQILRARADAGDQDAAGRLADLLAGRGDLEGLRARADAGD